MTKNRQTTDNTDKSIPANRMRLSDQMKKIRGAINLHIYNEFSEDVGDDLQVTEAEQEGKIVGRYVTKGDQVIETQSSHDAQTSGAHKEIAKAVGIKESDITHTSATESAREAIDESEDWGEGAADLGVTSEDQVDTPDEPEESKKADLHVKSEQKGSKPKKSTEGSKPDSSLSDMASQESGEYDGGPDLTKSDEGESQSLKALRERMKQKRQPKPGSSDDKIAAALASQSSDDKIAAALASQRGDSTPAPKDPGKHARIKASLDKIHALMESVKSHPSTTTPTTDPREVYNQHKNESDSLAQKESKLLPIDGFETYDEHGEETGDQYHVFMATHPDHKNMVGQHHLLDGPVSHDKLKDYVNENLLSEIDHGMSQGHNRMIIHQPEVQTKKQKGGLGLVKSYDIEQKDGALIYTKKKPEERTPETPKTPEKPIWKQKWEQKTTGERAAFQKKLSDQRKGLIKSSEKSCDLSTRSSVFLERLKKLKKKDHKLKKDAIAGYPQMGGLDSLGVAPDLAMSKSADALKQKIRGLADSYAGKKGIKLNHDIPVASIDQTKAAKIASAYESMPHNPEHPEVKSAYNSLISETADQLHHLKQSGMKFSKITSDMENPYKGGSKDMFKDMHENNHLWFFPTESGFGGESSSSDHPLLSKVKLHDGEEWVANDAFRVVHDVFGHGKEGNGFGPKGEEHAWKHHMQMYSPSAQKALTSETRGQNSWVNFGPHGEDNKKNPENTKYAEQKAGILPDWAHK